jgi:hypothetical protein
VTCASDPGAQRSRWFNGTFLVRDALLKSSGLIGDEIEISNHLPEWNPTSSGIALATSVIYRLTL